MNGESVHIKQKKVRTRNHVKHSLIFLIENVTELIEICFIVMNIYIWVGFLTNRSNIRNINNIVNISRC